jgi:hypothetical protein
MPVRFGHQPGRRGGRVWLVPSARTGARPDR